MTTAYDRLFEKISRLPPDRIAEVEAFIDLLVQRAIDREFVLTATAASEVAFDKVWSDPEDDIYDQVLGQPAA